MTHHAAERWARAVLGVLRAESDPKNVAAWGRAIGVGPGTLRIWCRAAGERPKNSLDFARMLRAIVAAADSVCDLQNALDIIDQRTIGRLLMRCGLRQVVASRRVPSVREFIGAQRLVHAEHNLRAVRQLLPGDTDQESSRMTSEAHADCRSCSDFIACARIEGGQLGRYERG